ncbi:hypothetical protein A0H81_08351 [Grifola frondosa]|uniref:Uncharacterized protein n=1 Tax=Grifola frondosa TaxID=5627 RepID=A0A1C7M2V9_GRIFR|nr:hypothetical protein A0H81_08351 [Grifola frondosa]
MTTPIAAKPPFSESLNVTTEKTRTSTSHQFDADSNTISSPSVDSGPSSTTNIELGMDFNATVVRECERIIEKYRKDQIHKSEASYLLLKAIEIDESTEIGELRSREAAYETFFNQLDECDQSRQRAKERGAKNIASEFAIEIDPAGTTRDVNSESNPQREPTARSSKHRRDSSESDDEPEPKSKKSVDESLFPFASRVQLELSPELQRTLALKENYTRDLAFTKQKFLCQPDCPEIPDAIWDDILRSRYADLDKIFTAVYTVDGDHKTTLKLGDLEVVAGPSKPTKHIQRHGQWTVAWSKYQQGVIYAFPH